MKGDTRSLDYSIYMGVGSCRDHMRAIFDYAGLYGIAMVMRWLSIGLYRS